MLQLLDKLKPTQRCWLLGALLATLVLSPGCRSLRSGRQTRALATARQLSLQGADELQQEKFSNAELLFAKALTHSPADERAHWGMAEVLWQQGEHATAIEHMARAAEISGASPDLLVRLGEMYGSERMFDEALAQADAALSGQRDHCGAWALRGKVLQEQDRLEESLFSYHRALHGRAYYPEVQVALAQIYQKLGRPQRALATLDGMLDSRADDEFPASAWLLKGRALADLGQQNDARKCLRQAALGAGEEDTNLLLAVAESQIEFGDLAEARVCLGRVMQYDPYNPRVQHFKEALDRSFQSYSSNASLVGFERPAKDEQK